MTQSEAIDAGENIILLDINKLVVTSQPMIEASQIEKDGLSESIEEVGLLYPLLVKPLGSGKKYEVLDGRTRLEVLKGLGRSTVLHPWHILS